MVDLAYLKSNVFPGESGGDYDALYGYSNRQGGAFAGVRPSQMTVAQVMQLTDPRGPYAQWVRNQLGYTATPVGAYQVVGSTLRDAVTGLGLTGNEQFDQATQDRIAQWIYQQQGPGAWEGWGKGGGGGGGVTMSTSGGPSMVGLLDYGQQEPQGFGERLRRGARDGSLMDSLALAFNSLRLNPDQGIGQLVQSRAEKRENSRAVNRTAQWLASQGREDLAAAMLSGALDPKAAAQIAMTPPEDNRTAMIQNYEYWLSQGKTPDEAAELARAGGGGTNVTIGEPLKIMPNGQIAIRDDSVEGGVRFVTPPGTQAATEAAAAAEKAAQRETNAETYGDAAIQAIDDLIGPEGNSGMINDGEGLFNISNVGIVGQRLADWQLSQSAVNVANTLKTVTSNIAFSRLQAMRDASATGGALGSVTENELAMLMNSLGAVQQNTDPALLRKNLATIRRIWTKIQTDPVARQAYAAAGAAGSVGAATVAQPSNDGFTVTGSW